MSPLGINWIPGMDSKNNFLYPCPGSGLPFGGTHTNPSSVWTNQAAQRKVRVTEPHRSTGFWLFDPKGRAWQGLGTRVSDGLPSCPVGLARQQKFSRKHRPKDQMGHVGKGGRNKDPLKAIIKELVSSLSSTPVCFFPRLDPA